jgi:hypothetical protein
MIPQAFAENIVARQLGRLIADAEALLAVVARRDLPAGLRIIDCAGGWLAGGSLGSGHKLARAHGCRPGAVAVLVAAEYRLRFMLELWHDNLPAALGEAGLGIEAVAAHELAHALLADPDPELSAGEGDTLRRLPAAVAEPRPSPADRTARDHGAAWAAGLVILGERCRRYRPGARHRWPVVIADDLGAVGIDAEAVARAVGDVADELPLRELLAPGGGILERVAEAIPCEPERARLIAQAQAAGSGHVAPAAAGVPQV